MLGEVAALVALAEKISRFDGGRTGTALVHGLTTHLRSEAGQ